LVPYFEGVDLLYHEATFMEVDSHRAAETFHCTARQAGQLAKLASVKKLLLGHFSSRYPDLSDLLAEAQIIFPNSLLSEEGITYPIPSSHELIPAKPQDQFVCHPRCDIPNQCHLG
jgi:ribonuclease Z